MQPVYITTTAAPKTIPMASTTRPPTLEPGAAFFNPLKSALPYDGAVPVGEAATVALARLMVWPLKVTMLLFDAWEVEDELALEVTDAAAD